MEISRASDEQLNAVSQMKIGIEQISAVIQSTSATAEESAAASEELSGQANMLKDMISKFRFDENGLVYSVDEKQEVTYSYDYSAESVNAAPGNAKY